MTGVATLERDKKLIFGIPQYEFILLVVVHICALLTCVHNNTIHTLVSLAAIGCTCFLAFNSHIYLLLPVYMIFYEQIVPFSGFVGYRIYTLIVIVSCLFNKKLKFSFKNTLFYFFLLVYILTVFYNNGSSSVVSCIINFLFLILYCDNYIQDSDNYKKFFGFFIFSAVLSAFYGFFGGSSGMEQIMLVNGKRMEYTRFLATFNDPNYLGLVFNIAIFSAMCIIQEKRWTKIFILSVCYIAIIATMSITAIIVNIIFLAVYFVFVKKLNPVIIPLMIIICVLAITAYNSSLKTDMGIVTSLSQRIQEKITHLDDGEVDSLTTNRTRLTRENMNSFYEKSPFGIIFGGAYITSAGWDKSSFGGLSHNEFVDNLLLLGVLGTAIYWLYFISNFKSALKKTKEKAEIHHAIIFVKFIYLAYCFTLTIFPDIRLMFLFFL